MADENDTTNTTTPEELAKEKAAAEKRAADAEKRTKTLEEAEAKRREEEDRQRRDAEMKTLDDAKRTIADLEKREKEAQKRADQLQADAMERINARFEKLPKDVREKIAPFKDHLPVAQWEQMIDMEGGRSADNSGGGDPTPNPRGGGRRSHKQAGAPRDLHPRSIEILDDIGEDYELARHLIDVEKDPENPGNARFVYPQKKLRKHLKERSLRPLLLTEENRRKIFGA